ncbi:MAG: methyltransferase domain-containing protein [Candidatus Aminicenantes bacterium]|nr:methyltransferase domain-containing protein [Candidatus Aminicenantes bacterium]
MSDLKEKYKKDNIAWDQCAETYETQIVGGHPDIYAFENFEEDFLDRLLLYLIEKQVRPIKIMDLGCGSGRLHIRYGAKTVDNQELQKYNKLKELKKTHPELAYDSQLFKGLSEVWGIDFSSRMIALARKKIKETQLDQAHTVPLTLDQGSAFELEAEPEDVLPVAVNLVNSICVMQGPQGAKELFKSMKRAVEKAGGIAIISNYQREYIESYGIGQYESTLDVSGHPWWMVPDTYASSEYRFFPKHYIRAYTKDPQLHVDVFDQEGNLVKENHVLKRDPERTREVVETGHIRTHTDYESHWYSFKQMNDWIETYWKDSGETYHFKTSRLDRLRAEPAQMSILDSGDHLKDLFTRWKLV